MLFSYDMPSCALSDDQEYLTGFYTFAILGSLVILLPVHPGQLASYDKMKLNQLNYNDDL